ncbi:MAG: iron-siderophore ABC transporter substrate-binding protein [Cyanobacteria bacterium P01_E01_bin.42]
MIFSKFSQLITLILLIAFLIISCQGDDYPMSQSVSDSSSEIVTCQTIEHGAGETKICGQPQRIAVLGPYVLEPLLALNVQPIAYADHFPVHQGDYTNPEQQIPYLGDRITQPLANIGQAFTPSLEALLKIEPDLILGTDLSNASLYETLSKIAPTLLVNYDEPEESLRTIAQAVNRTEQVQQVLAQRARHIEKAREAFAPFVATHPNIVLLAASQLQKMYWERPNSPCSLAIEELGFQRLPLPDTVPASSAPMSLEVLPQLKDADSIVVLGFNFNGVKQRDRMGFKDEQLSSLKQEWAKNPITQSLDASKTGRVYFIPLYLCRGLPGAIGTQLYLEELQEELLILPQQN